MVKVSTVRRPYLLTFESGNSYVLSSIEAQRLIDSYPAVKATRNRITLRGDDGTLATIQAATYGGGFAFEVSK